MWYGLFVHLFFVTDQHVCDSTDWVLELGILKRGRVLKALWDSGRSFQQQKVEGLSLIHI